MSFSNDEEKKRSVWGAPVQQELQGAWGKQPLRNDVADRIKTQTHENLQRRLRDQIAEYQNKLTQEVNLRSADRAQFELETAASLVLIDKLLDFIAQNFGGDLPPTLHEMIAERQEQRLLVNPVSPFEDSMSPSAQLGGHRVTNIAPASDGQVLRMGRDGKVGFGAVNPPAGSESPASSASEAMRRLLKHLE